ncbi:S1 family peptidase [Alicyclobacillus mengziensis]|uniref:Trypsin-like peptidase domain-containing protein n=1 Tax=Alicyclobacillus mengziensis TaxID=2931921 RepID=A0A9X7VYR2_9BACL|nr:serine protease [Alicyclobacillus mengziensis]QSO47563.1 trypsin-like peptidase domain-containing protein [Alicyclobacillus mengziensis]
MRVWVFAAIVGANVFSIGAIAYVYLSTRPHSNVSETKVSSSSVPADQFVVNTTPPVQKTPLHTATVPIPASPSGVRVSSVGSSFVSLSWNDSVMDRNAYIVYRGTTPVFRQARVVDSTTGTSFIDRYVQPNTVYYYWVASQNAAGTSTPKTAVKVQTYLSWSQIEQRYQDSVVKIKTYTSDLGVLGSYVEGTGWFAPGGYIVTNWHVIRNWHWDIDVILHHDGGQYKGQLYHAKVVYESKSHDLAILKLNNGWSGNPLRIASASAVAGQRVAALGHPGGEALTLTQGRVVATGVAQSVSSIGTLPDMTRSTIPCVGGSSGSPVFDGYGQVVGVMESADPNDGNISYFVPATFLSQWGIN